MKINSIHLRLILNNYKKVGLKLLFVLTALLFSQCESHSQVPESSGKAVGISNGDTFTLLTHDKQQIKVRLSEIDAPEKAQPFGTRSREVLSDLIFSKDVLVVQEDIDGYGRLVGHVYVDGTHVNRRMVQEGMIWVYVQCLKDKTLLQDEKAAKEANRGLWVLPVAEQVPPWEWRRGDRVASLNTGAEDNKPAFECGTKQYCKKMSSCDEAMYYLQHCGLTRLDGDGDGVPCEVLCK